MRIGAFADRAARELSGFNQNSQMSLDFLLDKLNRNRQLDDQEWQQVAQFASEEREYTRQKEQYSRQLQDQLAAEDRQAGRERESATTAFEREKQLREISASNSGTTRDDKQQEKMISDFEQGRTELQGGVPWGDVWNRMKALYPSLTNDYIDQLLGTSFREPGAFERFSGNSDTSNPYGG